jgi:hypothetical protein
MGRGKEKPRKDAPHSPSHILLHHPSLLHLSLHLSLRLLRLLSVPSRPLRLNLRCIGLMGLLLLLLLSRLSLRSVTRRSELLLRCSLVVVLLVLRLVVRRRRRRHRKRRHPALEARTGVRTGLGVRLRLLRVSLTGGRRLLFGGELRRGNGGRRRRVGGVSGLSGPDPLLPVPDGLRLRSGGRGAVRASEGGGVGGGGSVVRRSLLGVVRVGVTSGGREVLLVLLLLLLSGHLRVRK